MLMKGRQLIRLSVALPVECNPMWLSLGFEQPPIRAGAVREQIWDVRGWVVAVLLGFFFFWCVCVFVTALLHLLTSFLQNYSSIPFKFL